MPEDLSDLRYELALANRMMANEGVLDAFGHVAPPPGEIRTAISCRVRAHRTWSSPAKSWNSISTPIRWSTSLRLYSERVIHGEIYKARPDVTAVCHYHCPRCCPSASRATDCGGLSSGRAGDKLPFWDQLDDFGDTYLCWSSRRRALARPRARQAGVVLMRGHGATVVASTCVIGVPHDHLPQRGIPAPGGELGEFRRCAGESRQAGTIFAMATCNRAWEYWRRLDKAGGLPPPRAAKSSGARPRAASASRRFASKTTRGQEEEEEPEGRR